MTDSERSSCHKIIHTAATAASGAAAGLAQLPCSDNALIMPIEITMIISLARVFGKSLDRDTAWKLLKVNTAKKVGRTISQFLVGWMPGIGNAVNAATAAGVVESLGWYMAHYFDNHRG